MKRVFWSTVGYVAGLGTSVYVQRRVRRAVEYYTPEQVRRDAAVVGRQVAGRAPEVVIDLREAAAEGGAGTGEDGFWDGEERVGQGQVAEGGGDEALPILAHALADDLEVESVVGTSSSP